MTIAAMKAALEALESCDNGDYSTGHVIRPSFNEKDVDNAITALRAAIEQAEKCEPVAWRWSERGFWFSWTTDFTHHGKALRLNCPVEYAYAHPAPMPGENHD